MQTSHAALTKSLQEALDGASRDLKHWRAVLLFPIRTLHAIGSALNVPSDSHDCKDILEYMQAMNKGYNIYFSETTPNPILAEVMVGRSFCKILQLQACKVHSTSLEMEFTRTNILLWVKEAACIKALRGTQQEAANQE